MQKKNEFLVIFMIFQLLEIMKKKKFIKKNEKKYGADFEWATAQLCFKEGNCIAILDFLLQRFRL